MHTVRKSVCLAGFQGICETDHCKAVPNILSKNVIFYYSGTGARKGFPEIEISGSSIQELSSQQGEETIIMLEIFECFVQEPFPLSNESLVSQVLTVRSTKLQF